MRPRRTPPQGQGAFARAGGSLDSSAMRTTLAVLLALGVGALLTFGAARATASVQRGGVFLRWMLVVFATYLALITLPVVVAF